MLESLINNSGDSTLEKCEFSGGVLSIHLKLFSSPQTVLITIETDVFSCNNSYLRKREEWFRTCRIEMTNVSEVLDVENGFYIPGKTFAEVMKESRSNYNLFYGKRAEKVLYIFSLIGYDVLLSCSVANLGRIKVEYIDTV